MDARNLAAFDQGRSSGRCACVQGSLHRGHVAGDHDEKLSGADGAGEQEADCAGLQHQVFDKVAGSHTREFNQSYRIDFRSHVCSSDARLYASIAIESFITVTTPAMLAWIRAPSLPGSGVANKSPSRTRSPHLTTGTAGAPAC